MALTLTQFIKKYNGTKVDYDKQYGPQCVDLARQYFEDCYGLSKEKQPPGVDGAKDLIKNPGSSLHVTLDSELADYSKGDVLVWGANKNNKFGHVAILVAIYNTRYFIVFEQDGFKQDGAKLAFRDRANLLGCLYKM